MSKIGIIGGLSPFSTVVYYSRIVEEFNHLKGGLNYPEILVSSLNMADAKAALNSNDDDVGLRLLVGAITDLPTADFFLIASNTMHFYVDKLRSICPREVIDIRQACDALSDAQGRSTQEDVVNEIFSRFCLGK